MNRRQFLKQAAAACVGAVAGVAGAGMGVVAEVKHNIQPFPHVCSCSKCVEFRSHGHIKWKTYYNSYDSSTRSATAIKMMKAAAKARPFKVPLGGWI